MEGSLRRLFEDGIVIVRTNPPLVFVHVPKTAGGSITNALAQDGDVLGDPVFGAHAWAGDVRKRFPDVWPDAFKFAVVRDPWDLLVSRWLEFERTDERYPCLAGMRQAYRDAFGDFSGWVKFVCERGTEAGSTEEQLIGSRTDPQWVRLWFRSFHATQTEMLCDAEGDVLVDQIIRFDQISEDLKPVLTKYGNGTPLSTTVNATRETDKKSWYVDETREMVRKRFARDLELGT